MGVIYIITAPARRGSRRRRRCYRHHRRSVRRHRRLRCYPAPAPENR